MDVALDSRMECSSRCCFFSSIAWSQRRASWVAEYATEGTGQRVRENRKEGRVGCLHDRRLKVHLCVSTGYS